MNRPTIRPVQMEDVAAITRIYADAVTNGTVTFELDPPDAREMRQRVATLVEKGFPYVVAEMDGVVAGYAYAGPYRPRLAFQWTVENAVYVDPEYKRHGLGRRLLATLIAEAEARGFRQMIAIIGEEANAGSIALHRSFDFRHAGTLHGVGYKHGAWRATVLMQRPLGLGSDLPPDDAGGAGRSRRD